MSNEEVLTCFKNTFEYSPEEDSKLDGTYYYQRERNIFLVCSSNFLVKVDVV